MKLIGLNIKELVQIGCACPSQWEGVLVDGRAIYIKFRNRILDVYLNDVNGTIGDAIATNPVFSVETDADEGRGISLSKVKNLSGLEGPKLGG